VYTVSFIELAEAVHEISW